MITDPAIIRALNEAADPPPKDQQLVARIKRSSKYWGQTPPNRWFDVRIVRDNYYQLRGNSNNYRICDVVMGIRFADGSVLDLVNGKTTLP